MKEKRYTLPNKQEPAFVGEPTNAYHGNTTLVYPKDAVDELEEDYNNQNNIPFFGPKTMQEAHMRIKQAEEEYERGECTAIKDFEQILEKKYPWLT